MPNIKPISDLRNYTDVLKEVDISSRVYLTRNGRGEYGILTMEEIDELDRLKAIYTLNKKLQEAEAEAEREGWISEEDLKKELYWLKEKCRPFLDALKIAPQKVMDFINKIIEPKYRLVEKEPDDLPKKKDIEKTYRQKKKSKGDMER